MTAAQGMLTLSVAMFTTDLIVWARLLRAPAHQRMVTLFVCIVILLATAGMVGVFLHALDNEHETIKMFGPHAILYIQPLDVTLIEAGWVLVAFAVLVRETFRTARALRAKRAQ